ncbi:AMP-binding protein, partial [Aliikangiella sp. G2MR2-5]|uniref:AMP-binding protein n=1 Tax=Aliikangiella sp. G2MR2-5 TaxID=2788943 RepID=UPI0018AA0ED6
MGEIFQRVDCSTNYCFDLTVANNICPLLAGGTVVVYSGELTDLVQYQHHLETNKINFVKTTPSLAVLIELNNYKLDTLLVGGERLTAPCTEHVYSISERFFNEYGPTEATVGSTVTRVSNSEQLHIGSAFPNVKLYVLNEKMQPVPTGSIGELYIGGAGVARGYWNRPELTTS